MSTPSRFLLLFCLTAAILAVPAAAQFDSATVLGTVREATQAVVAGATVTLLNAETGIRAVTTSDENGNYQFLTVKVGTYKVTAEMPGFSTAVADRVTVTISARQRVDLELKVGAVSEVV